MNGTEITVWKTEDGELDHLRVSRSSARVTVPEFKIGVGTRITVLPSNTQKKHHRGRTGVVVGFVLDDLGNPMKLDVRFDDNNRRGRVDISDAAPAE